MAKELIQEKKSSWNGLLVCAAVVATLLTGRVIIDTFSLDGLSYVLGSGSGDGLVWPAGSVALFWLCCVETIALAGTASNYLAGRWRGRWFVKLFWGHVTASVWVVKVLQTVGVAVVAGVQWGLDRRRTLSTEHAPVKAKDEDHPYATTG